MKLYHGTSEAVAKKALGEGLKPRGKRKGNWQHTVNSRTDAVYLTDIYGPYFAFATTKRGKRAAILEIDTTKLDPNKFMPDEDFLEQATRGREGPGYAPKHMSMKARTEYYRAIAEINPQLWPKSLENLGTVSYRGVIPPEAISRVAYVERNARMLMEGADAMIMLLNHQICKPKYEALTKWFFGDEIKPEDFDFALSATNAADEKWAEMLKGRREHLQGLLADRSAVEVACA